ncbi:MAG TPA: hypothetical protein VKX17_02915, partial [Planctomycetota bacterium]|nr:hypothetical protein [Planctomycetota bacterium]
LTRLHDCHWPNPDVVDIHTLFPDFKADPNLSESYTFSRTDEYVQAIVNAGSGIVFRLGESIEHTPKKYYVAPPADCERWAAICIGIIRHYNEGWAGGFKHNIHYWEIWNEPENRPQMWTGSDADYFTLYAAASRAIKARFPNVMVGGPAVGNTGRIENGKFEPSAFLNAFLDMCARDSLPLDFFSWHHYSSDPLSFAARAKEMRALLDRRGFAKTESHLNEWNYLPRDDWTPMLLGGQGVPREKFFDEIGGAPGAAFSATALLTLQDSPLDAANYYTGEIQGFGLFNFYGVPKKTFYAFKAFKLLLETPNRVSAHSSDGKLAICAGLSQNKSSAQILISSFQSNVTLIKLVIEHAPWNGAVICEKRVVDGTRDLKLVWTGALPAGGALDLSAELKAPAACLIKLRKAE